MDWDSAHHDYSIWDSAPHGPLLHNNSMFDLIRSRSKVHLVHITARQGDIESAGTIYPSAGCLVGSIYCTPAFEHGSRLRVHNLGAYYYLHEVDKNVEFYEGRYTGKDIIIFEIDQSRLLDLSVQGVNYLRMGNIHCDIYERYTHLVKDRQRMERKLCKQIKNEEELLKQCVEAYRSPPGNTQQTLDLLEELSRATTENIPFFGYIMFEALSISLMLFQEDDFSNLCADRREFCSWNYKELMYTLFPALGTNFRLSSFAPDWRDLFLRVQQEGFVKPRLIERLPGAVLYRALKYICANCLTQYLRFSGFERVESVKREARPLFGHMVHREFRNVSTEEYRKSFLTFESEKAKTIWNYWNRRGIVLPFNGVIPKGEIGINPHTDVPIQAFVGEPEVEGRDLYLKKGRQLKLKIALELGSLQHMFLRDKNGIQKPSLDTSTP